MQGGKRIKKVLLLEYNKRKREVEGKTNNEEFFIVITFFKSEQNLIKSR